MRAELNSTWVEIKFCCVFTQGGWNQARRIQPAVFLTPMYIDLSIYIIYILKSTLQDPLKIYILLKDPAKYMTSFSNPRFFSFSFFTRKHSIRDMPREPWASTAHIRKYGVGGMQPAPPTIGLGISTGGMHLINLIKM